MFSFTTIILKITVEIFFFNYPMVSYSIMQNSNVVALTILKIKTVKLNELNVFPSARRKSKRLRTHFCWNLLLVLELNLEYCSDYKTLCTH